MIREQINQLIEAISTNQDPEELFQAKKEYQKISGQIFEDDKSYESRMGLFLEWFVFDRPLGETSRTPATLFLEEKKSTLSLAMVEICEELGRGINSLFIIKKIDRQRVVALELFDDKKYEVQSDSGNFLFNKSDVFESRLISYQGKYYFTENFCYHPNQSFGYIKSCVKKIRSEEKSEYKELSQIQKDLAKLEKKLQGLNKDIEKIRLKLGKTNKDKKIQSLNQELENLESSRQDLEKQIKDTQAQKMDMEEYKIKIGHRARRSDLLRRLSYMSLMWERSRQIDIKDIYRD
jgi:DNA repair exonuclease SbcCD ATPase subunit